LYVSNDKRPLGDAPYVKIVDEVLGMDMRNKARLTALCHQAMDIWLSELPGMLLPDHDHRSAFSPHET
jgi:hypothetical protein